MAVDELEDNMFLEHYYYNCLFEYMLSNDMLVCSKNKDNV